MSCLRDKPFLITYMHEGRNQQASHSGEFSLTMSHKNANISFLVGEESEYDNF